MMCAFIYPGCVIKDVGPVIIILFNYVSFDPICLQAFEKTFQFNTVGVYHLLSDIQWWFPPSYKTID